MLERMWNKGSTPPLLVWGGANVYNHLGNKYDDFSEYCESNYLKTQ